MHRIKDGDEKERHRERHLRVMASDFLEPTTAPAVLADPPEAGMEAPEGPLCPRCPSSSTHLVCLEGTVAEEEEVEGVAAVAASPLVSAEVPRGATAQAGLHTCCPLPAPEGQQRH